MATTPDKHTQIIRTHAGLIVAVAKATQNRDSLPQLEQALTASKENGWGDLVAVIRKILKGNRDPALFNNLDEEDRWITEAILKGIQDPTTLPDPNEEPDASMAAPMLASLINEARRGDTNALSMLGAMAEQMSQTQGDMARFSTLIKPLIDGERDADKLCEIIGPQGQSLITSILDELSKLEIH